MQAIEALLRLCAGYSGALKALCTRLDVALREKAYFRRGSASSHGERQQIRLAAVVHEPAHTAGLVSATYSRFS